VTPARFRRIALDLPEAVESAQGDLHIRFDAGEGFIRIFRASCPFRRLRKRKSE